MEPWEAMRSPRWWCGGVNNATATEDLVGSRVLLGGTFLPTVGPRATDQTEPSGYFFERLSPGMIGGECHVISMASPEFGLAAVEFRRACDCVHALS